ncbi:MAG: phosphate ABC transporter permease PstA [Bacilli bacterium]
MNISKSYKRNKSFFSSLKITSYITTIISLICLFAIILYVLIKGIPHLSFDLLFGTYGDTPSIFPAFIGTLELVAISIAIAAPIGIFSAIFLVEYVNTKSIVVRIIRLATETLAGIPSIVYGLFGYLIFVVGMGWGYSILGGSITLSIMVLPVIVRSTEESLLAVPNALREGSYALGTSKVRTIFKIILPCASPGIVTSLILAIGRVVSESAVLILTIGMVVNKVPSSLLSAGTSLALDIYYFASYGYPNEAAATSVVLLLFIIVINLSATLIGNLLRKGKNFNECY